MGYPWRKSAVCLLWLEHVKFHKGLIRLCLFRTYRVPGTDLLLHKYCGNKANSDYCANVESESPRKRTWDKDSWLINK